MSDADGASASARLRVLAVAADVGLVRRVEQACAVERCDFSFATDAAEAIALGASEEPDLALVDVSFGDGAGLALVHHLPAVCRRTRVFAIVPPPYYELWSQAETLGAAGVLLSPPTEEALGFALAEARTRAAALRERTRLLVELEAWKQRAARFERVARLAGGGDRAEIALAVAEGLAEASGASGAAIYVVDGARADERTRLAAVGSAAMLDAKGALGQSLEGAQLLTLTLAGRPVGYAFLDNPSRGEPEAIEALQRLAAALLGGP